MNRYLFEDMNLPAGFQFPASYRAMLSEPELPDLDPWWFLANDRRLATFWINTLRGQYPDRRLVPFAKHGGSDDVACFDLTDTTGNPKVVYIHAYASPGWEFRGELGSFDEWLEKTRAESAEYKADTEQ